MRGVFNFFRFILDEGGQLELRFTTFYSPDMDTLKNQVIDTYPFILQTNIQNNLNNTVLYHKNYKTVPKNENIVLILNHINNKYYVSFVLHNIITNEEKILGNIIEITQFDMYNFLKSLLDKTHDFFIKGCI
jgi:hypothetical protein